MGQHKKLLKNFALYSSSFLFTGGITIGLGFLSFAGMLAIYPSIPFALLAFGLTVIVEGQVFGRNFIEGLRRFLSKDDLARRILEQKLKNIIDLANYDAQQATNYTNIKYHDNLKKNQKLKNSFLQKYINIRYHLDYLNSLHNLNSAQQRAKINAEKNLKTLLDNAIGYIAEAKAQDEYDAFEANIEDSITLDPQQQAFDNLLDINAQKRLHSKIIIYLWCSRILLACTALAAISAGFAMADSIYSGLILTTSFFGISLPATVLSAGVWIIAALAAVAYIFAIYKTFSDILQNATVQNKWRKFKEKFKDHNIIVATLLVLATVIIIGLTIFATIATAGTWWIATKNGLKLIPYVAHFASWIRSITVPFYTGTTFAFLLKNSFETITKISKYKIPNNWSIHNWWINCDKRKVCNPFYWIITIVSKSIGAILFLAHSISSALQIDRAGGHNFAVFTTGCGTVSDCVSDAAFCLDHTDHIHYTQEGHSLETKVNAILAPHYDHYHGIFDVVVKAIQSSVIFLPSLLSVVTDQLLQYCLDTPEDDKRSLGQSFKMHYTWWHDEHEHDTPSSPTTPLSPLGDLQYIMPQVDTHAPILYTSDIVPQPSQSLC
jgi:hypothetical protein